MGLYLPGRANLNPHDREGEGPQHTHKVAKKPHCMSIIAIDLVSCACSHLIYSLALISQSHVECGSLL